MCVCVFFFGKTQQLALTVGDINGRGGDGGEWCMLDFHVCVWVYLCVCACVCARARLCTECAFG